VESAYGDPESVSACDRREDQAIPAALRQVTRGRALLVADYAENRSGLRRLMSELCGPGGRGGYVGAAARRGPSVSWTARSSSPAG
jgi:hypothetical protein